VPANQPMGMPQNCEPVAAWDGKQVWLRAWMFAREGCSHGAGAFGSTSPDYRFTLEGPATLTIQRVLEAAAAAMKDPHLMVVSNADDRSVDGTAPRGRTSLVFPGKREWGTVQVFVEPNPQPRPGRAGWKINVLIAMALNPQNTSAAPDWHPLDETQQAQYNA